MGEKKRGLSRCPFGSRNEDIFGTVQPHQRLPENLLHLLKGVVQKALQLKAVQRYGRKILFCQQQLFTIISMYKEECLCIRLSLVPYS